MKYVDQVSGLALRCLQTGFTADCKKVCDKWIKKSLFGRWGSVHFDLADAKRVRLWSEQP